MKKLYLLLATVFLLPEFVVGQMDKSKETPYFAPVKSVRHELLAKTGALPGNVSDAVFLELQPAVVKHILAEKPLNMSMELPFLGGKIEILRLDKYEILAPDARIVAGTEFGDKEIEIEFVSYRGMSSS
jgi:hypothetical protein